jgi:hypothetical protein
LFVADEGAEDALVSDRGWLGFGSSLTLETTAGLTASLASGLLRPVAP